MAELRPVRHQSGLTHSGSLIVQALTPQHQGWFLAALQRSLGLPWEKASHHAFHLAPAGTSSTSSWVGVGLQVHPCDPLKARSPGR